MNELEKKQQEYFERFGEAFPMIPLAWGRSEAEVIEVIDECLKENKDAYELGYVKDDLDIEY